ncbi:DNA-directed RNA polymerase I subunit RPA2 [Trichonephila inaurata madagascariensis]|uniref:DNA-directed RNA polymerase n=1 Tax=Trichonephila inaurata madagascariensis TaxID=2747483 RepID=A0A8X6Y3J8_9ARAC|nr:DNA-directed RNA polymerase I subunit RPA2 [Trichonephila inaurata madagascariensis]
MKMVDFLEYNLNERKPSYVKEAARYHINSFNYLIDGGLSLALLDIDPVYTKTDPFIKISISGAELNRLQLPMDLRHHKRTVFPAEARMRSTTYYAELYIQLKFQTKTETEYSERIFFVPLMLKSNLCLLNEMDDEDLLKHKEDLNDPGGYFIVEGEERVLRTFIVPRRNYPLALINDKWKSIGDGYSEYGVLISCVKENHIFSDVSLHFVNCTKSKPYVSFDVRIFYQGKAYHIPIMLILKSLVDETDNHIIKEILKFTKESASLKMGKSPKDMSQDSECQTFPIFPLVQPVRAPSIFHGEAGDDPLRWLKEYENLTDGMTLCALQTPISF